MNIKFSPVRAEKSKAIHALTVSNGKINFKIENGGMIASDLSALVGIGEYDHSDPENPVLINESTHDYVLSCDADFNLTIKLPHGCCAPESTRFPESLVDVQEGVVNVPAYE
jgi:hypothetical protein